MLSFVWMRPIVCFNLVIQFNRNAVPSFLTCWFPPSRSCRSTTNRESPFFGQIIRLKKAFFSLQDNCLFHFSKSSQLRPLYMVFMVPDSGEYVCVCVCVCLFIKHPFIYFVHKNINLILNNGFVSDIFSIISFLIE